jgi:hypothetical protein
MAEGIKGGKGGLAGGMGCAYRNGKPPPSPHTALRLCFSCVVSPFRLPIHPSSLRLNNTAPLITPPPPHYLPLSMERTRFIGRNSFVCAVCHMPTLVCLSCDSGMAMGGALWDDRTCVVCQVRCLFGSVRYFCSFEFVSDAVHIFRVSGANLCLPAFDRPAITPPNRIHRV